MASVATIPKPAQARWLAKAIIAPSGDARVHAMPPGETHSFGDVEIAWYENSILKITLSEAGPGKITQSYLKGEGRDVIIEIELAQ